MEETHLTPRQIAARKKAAEATRAYHIAGKGERERTAKHMNLAAIEVLKADIQAMKENRAERPAHYAADWIEGAPV